PFWKQLTSLTLDLTTDPSAALTLLRDRMPESLRKLRLYVPGSHGKLSGIDSFFARLGDTPLQSLHLKSFPIRATTLHRVLDGTNRWKLRELTLLDCDIGEVEAQAIAGAPGVKHLESLNVSWYSTFGDSSTKVLFASEHLRSLVDLNLSGTLIGEEGILALTRADGWNRLRCLDLLPTDLTDGGLRAILAAPNLRSLNW